MIISEQQARLAAQYVRRPPGSSSTTRPAVPPELMRRILGAVDAVPDTRSDRIVEAKARLLQGSPKPSEIAEKIIARAICDALR
jgi:hypothetical protein